MCAQSKVTPIPVELNTHTIVISPLKTVRIARQKYSRTWTLTYSKQMTDIHCSKLECQLMQQTHISKAAGKQKAGVYFLKTHPQS